MYGRRCLIMGRTTIQVTTLHGYTIEDLIDLKNNTESKHSRLVLTTIIMRYNGYSNTEITEVSGLSSVSILKHIKNWNSIGIKSIEEHRGGQKPTKLSPDIVDDLLYVALHKSPNDFEFIGHTWTCALLALYINQTYGIEVSYVTIWSILKSNNLSFKRAQAKPTKANKDEQEAFKKNIRNTRYFRVFI